MATVRNTSDNDTQYTPRPGRRSWVWAVVAAIVALLLIYWVASAASHTPSAVDGPANTNTVTTTNGTTGGDTRGQ